MSTVRNAILDHLQGGGTITKITALAKPFATTNLGDKILILRRAGYPIEKRWKKSEKGRPFAEYFLPRKEQ